MILEAEFIEEAEMKADFGSGFPIGGKADYSIVANALKGSAEGNPIAITDVSPLEHEIMVSVDVGGATLTAQGKNLCPNDWEIGFINTSTGLNQSNTNYVRTKDYFTLDKNKTYFVSGINATDSNTVGWYFYDENKAFIKRYVYSFNRTISVSGAQGTIPEETAFYRLVVNTTDINVGLQIELGTTATEYEPYVEPITYTADENGNVAVPSIYPTTTLIADSGVTITAEYNKDTNKVIESLVNAIISLGGNV